VRITGDMQRRVIVCRMDAGLERPEERSFDHDLLGEAEARRGELLTAGLTIARWQAQSRDPAPSLRRLAGFDTWCARVRDPLCRLGHADPVASIEAARASDVDGQWRRALVTAWQARLSDRALTSQEAIRLGTHIDSITGLPTMPDLQEALLNVAGDRTGAANSRRLGHYLAQHEGRVIGGYAFQRAGTDRKTVVWKLCSR
jgi:putative DNA primase/helicase